MRLVRWFLLGLLLAACGAAPAPTATPQDAPVATPEPPRPTVTAPVERVFAVDTGASIMRYLAHGQGALGVIEIPGSFRLAASNVVLTPDADGYWLDVVLIVDGATATAPNGVFLSVLRTALEIDRYPTAMFAGRSDVPIRLDANGPVQFSVVGELELHGRKRPLSMPLTLTHADGTLHATGEVLLNLRDYEALVPEAIMNSEIVFSADITSHEVAEMAETQVP